MNEIRIVAEIGCNHNGDIEIAKKLLDKAKEAGADYAKFQLFKTELLVSPSAAMADYQKENVEAASQFEMLKKLELSKDEYKLVKDYAQNIGIKAFATAFDIESANYLASIGQNIWKIPSGEITNLPLLENISQLKCEGKEIILSTGMSSIDEIKAAVKILETSRHTKFTILQCNTQYPTLDDDMNLRVINTFKEMFPKWEVGLSDHSVGTVAAITSVGMGISFIEKHFTLDKTMDGPDHKASIEPDELKQLCMDVRRAKCMLGTADKYVTYSETGNKAAARKSIVASKKIKKGELFSVDNLTCKRPGTGISPMRWHDIIGTTAKRDFETNEMIEE